MVFRYQQYDGFSKLRLKEAKHTHATKTTLKLGLAQRRTATGNTTKILIIYLEEIKAGTCIFIERQNCNHKY